MSQKQKLGELLVQHQLVTQDQVDDALAAQDGSASKAENPRKLGYWLVARGHIKELDLLKFLAAQYTVPAGDLNRYMPQEGWKEWCIQRFPAKTVYQKRIVPLKRENKVVTLGMADPRDTDTIKELEFTTRFQIKPVVVGEYALDALLEKMYGPPPADLKTTARPAPVAPAPNAKAPPPPPPTATMVAPPVMSEEEDEEQNPIIELDDLMGKLQAEAAEVELLEQEKDDQAVNAFAADQAPVIALVNQIFLDAYNQGASDIHMEPMEKVYLVRFRIDGALKIQKKFSIPLKFKAAITRRVKIMASLNIAERRLPQDGRIKLKVAKKKTVDYRVSRLPTLFGEKIVARLLDKGNLTLDLKTFGFAPQAQKALFDAIGRPYGMVLVTGPTGSGKTTTLYSALSAVNTEDVNIMTAEDPVEYNMHGVNQVLVKTDIGMTFAAALKAFLRQDPNIILIGEIRDLETGGIAIKAALTGHLVLATLHTNDAPSTMTRLLDMGLEPFNVASAVTLVVAQRLVRRICSECKAEKVYPPEYLEAAHLSEEQKQWTFYEGTGKAKDGVSPCPKCGGTGLKGRVGVYEVMSMNGPLQRLVMTGKCSAADIKKVAIQEADMLTLRMDGLRKVQLGDTTLEQVVRETTADILD